jgi:hypothetical protein
MTTWNILKKFFSPMLVHPWDYFWNIVEALLISSYAIISLEITRRIIIAIQTEDSERLQTLLIFFVLLSIALTLGRFLLYKK